MLVPFVSGVLKRGLLAWRLIAKGIPTAVLRGDEWSSISM